MSMCVGRRGLASVVVHVVLPMESDAYSYHAGTRVEDKICITKLIQCPVLLLQCSSVAIFSELIYSLFQLNKMWSSL